MAHHIDMLQLGSRVLNQILRFVKSIAFYIGLFVHTNNNNNKKKKGTFFFLAAADISQEGRKVECATSTVLHQICREARLCHRQVQVCVCLLTTAFSGFIICPFSWPGTKRIQLVLLLWKYRMSWKKFINFFFLSLRWNQLWSDVGSRNLCFFLRVPPS